MEQHLVICPVLIKELRAVLKEIHGKPTVHPLDYSIHINADIMEQELQQSISTIQSPESDIGILIGAGCQALQPLSEIASHYKAQLPHEQNCIEMILGVERTKKLQENRTAIMTPGWITMMNQSIKDGNWQVEDARINMGWYDQILLLDTGTTPLTDEVIMDFFELIQVPIDVIKVELDHFKQVVSQLLQTTDNATER